VGEYLVRSERPGEASRVFGKLRGIATNATKLASYQAAMVRANPAQTVLINGVRVSLYKTNPVLEAVLGEADQSERARLDARLMEAMPSPGEREAFLLGLDPERKFRAEVAFLAGMGPVEREAYLAGMPREEAEGLWLALWEGLAVGEREAWALTWEEASLEASRARWLLQVASSMGGAAGGGSGPAEETMFASMDKNGNGFLTKKEIKNHLKHAEWAQPYITAERFHWSALWKQFDADGDGMVSRDEFAVMYQEELLPLLNTSADRASYFASLGLGLGLPKEDQHQQEARLLNLLSLAGRDRYLARLDPAERRDLEAVYVTVMSDYADQPARVNLTEEERRLAGDVAGLLGLEADEQLVTLAMQDEGERGRIEGAMLASSLHVDRKAYLAGLNYEERKRVENVYAEAVISAEESGKANARWRVVKTTPSQELRESYLSSLDPTARVAAERGYLCRLEPEKRRAYLASLPEERAFAAEGALLASMSYSDRAEYLAARAPAAPPGLEIQMLNAMSLDDKMVFLERYSPPEARHRLVGMYTESLNPEDMDVWQRRYQKRKFLRVRLRVKIEAVVQRQLDEMRLLLRRKAQYESGMSGGLVSASAMQYVVKRHYPDKDASQAQIDLEFEAREKAKKETIQKMKEQLKRQEDQVLGLRYNYADNPQLSTQLPSPPGKGGLTDVGEWFDDIS